MALSKDDYLALALGAISTYPTAAQFVSVGDQRTLALLGSICDLLAAKSAEQDIAELEPFIKAREGTVLADASLKGILPLARPAQITIAITNNNVAPISLVAGRLLLDAKGRVYVLDSNTTIGAGVTFAVTATQRTIRTFTHTVSGSQPFYTVLVPPSPTNSHLVNIEVQDAGGSYAFRPEFVNVAGGERVFHVETDAYRRVHVRFGAESPTLGLVVGTQPANGTVLTVRVFECDGLIDLALSGRISFETHSGASDSNVVMVVTAIPSAGADPHDIGVLRVLAQYPALYDHNVVYLGNFDFYLRRYLTGVSFLSVWNEQIEEQVRGASLNSINRLFISAVVPSLTTPLMQAQILDLLSRVDTSYSVVFVAATAIAQPLTVNVSVSVVHDPILVETQIRNLLITNYGEGSPFVSRGMVDALKTQAMSELLKTGVPALQDTISDFSFVFGAVPPPLPEQFKYLTNAQLTVNVTVISERIGLWNY